MLRLPAAIIEDISLRAGQLAALSQTCTALCILNQQPEVQLRYYLSIKHRRNFASIASRRSGAQNSGEAGCCSSQASSAERAASFGPSAVYGLLLCRSAPRNAQASFKTVQLMLACGSMVQLYPSRQQDATQLVAAAPDSTAAAGALDLLLSALPYAEHCLLQFCAASGHVQLVKMLLPRCTAPLALHGMLHYVKSSAFLAAAAGGHVTVLSELLHAGAAHWACQLPGASLTSSALDLSALGGHVQAMQLLRQFVANPSPYYLTAAADSACPAAMELALQQWFAQFSAVTAFSRAHVQQMHDALKVACQRGHVSAVRQLLAALHNTSNDDCCVLALTYASSTSNTDAIRAVLESPQLPVQLARGPKLLSKLAQAVASCIRIAILQHCRPALELLLHSLASSSSPLAAARPLLAPHMRFIFDQAAECGNSIALQLLLLLLPEHWEALTVSALEAALSEGHADVAATIKTLLIMQGPERGFAAAALSPEGNAGLARASLHGAFKGAAVRGDLAALQSLLQQGPEGPDDNMQLLLLRLAAGAGQEAAVRLLLGEFGGADPRLEANLRAVCRGAVHSGQLALLQSLASDRPRSALLSHITSQPDALAEYLRAALLCGQVDVAAWLVQLAHQQQEMELVRSTLSSLLTASRWELLNAGKGMSVHEVVFDLLKHLAATCLASRCGEHSSSTGSSSFAASAASVLSALGTPAAAHSQAAHTGTASIGADAATATAAALSSAGATSSSESVSAAAAAGASSVWLQHSSLGRALLQPHLLGQLVHVSQGHPWRLLTVVQLVDWWGLGTAPQQQQQQNRSTGTQDQAALLDDTAVEAQMVLADTAVLAHPHEHEQQQQQSAVPGPSEQELQQQQQSSDGDSSPVHHAKVAPRSSSGASISSDGSAKDGSSSSSSVTSTSSSHSGTHNVVCDILSPTAMQPAAAAAESGSPAEQATARGVAAAAGRGAEAGRLLPATSLEVGSLHSDDCQHTGSWLDDLLHKASRPAGTAGKTAAGSPPQQQQQQRPQKHQQQHIQRRDQQAAAGQLTAGQLPPLAKEWGGSWQALTGQVAQLHMSATSSQQQQQQQEQQPDVAARRPRQSFDYEQHIAQQLRHRQHQQHSSGRESVPGRAATAVAAARALRASLSQPFNQQHTSRCPVHPYMQQCSQHQHQQ